MEKYESIKQRINADTAIPIYSTYILKQGGIFVAQGNIYVIENIGGEIPNGTPYNDYADLYGIIADFKARRVYFCPSIQTSESEHKEHLELQTFGITIPLQQPNSDHDIRTAAAFDCIEAFMERNRAADCPIALYVADLSRQLLLPESNDTADNLTAQEIIGEIDNGAMSAMMFVVSEIARRATDRDTLANWIGRIYAAIPDHTERNRMKYDLNTATIGQPPQGNFENLPPLWKIKACGITPDYLAEIDKYGLKGTKQARLLELSAAMEKSAKMGDFSPMQDYAKEMESIRFADGSDEVWAQLNAPRQAREQEIAEHRNDHTTNYTLHDVSYYGYSCADGKTNKFNDRKLSFSACGVSVICAAAKHGKTLFLLDTAIKFATSSTGDHILYFSMEEDTAQIATKIYRAQARDLGIIDTEHGILNGVRRLIKENLNTGVNDEKIQPLRRSYDKVTERLHIARIGSDIDQATATIRTAIQNYRRGGGEVAIIFIDYLQLLRHTKNSYSRTDELSYICNALNDLSKSEQIAIITAAQFNRETKRGGKLDEWGIAMIGESQSIENIATDVYMVLNPNMVTLSETDKGKRATILRNYSSDDGIAYIENLISREHRSGGVCVLKCDYAWGILGDEVGSNDVSQQKPIF